jgi:hypothetical protein
LPDRIARSQGENREHHQHSTWPCRAVQHLSSSFGAHHNVPLRIVLDVSHNSGRESAGQDRAVTLGIGAEVHACGVDLNDDQADGYLIGVEQNGDDYEEGSFSFTVTDD